MKQGKAASRDASRPAFPLAGTIARSEKIAAAITGRTTITQTGEGEGKKSVKAKGDSKRIKGDRLLFYLILSLFLSLFFIVKVACPLFRWFGAVFLGRG